MRTSAKISERNRRGLQAIWKLAFTMVVGLMLQGTAFTQNWNQLGIDINSLHIGNQFGANICLSADGSTLAIGAPALYLGTPTEKNVLYGAVHIYAWNGKAWHQKGNALTTSVKNNGFGFALDLSADGNFLIVGTPYYGNKTNTNIGLAQVYSFENGQWAKMGNPLIGEMSEQLFGYSVAMSDDGQTVAVGAPSGKTGPESHSYVTVYQWYPNNQMRAPVWSAEKQVPAPISSWKQVGQTLYEPVASTKFGSHVDLNCNGKMLAVGAPSKNVFAQNCGEISIYILQNNAWQMLGTPIYGEFENEFLGQTFDLSDDGSTLAVGLPYSGGALKNTGTVEIYRWNSLDWVIKGSVLTGLTANDYFGYDVSLSANGNYLLVSAPYVEETNTIGYPETLAPSPISEAYAYVQAFTWVKINSYEFPENDYRNYAGKWENMGTMLLGKSANEAFGTSVAIAANKNIIAVGTPLSIVNDEVSTGYVRTFCAETPSIFTGYVNETMTNNRAKGGVTTLPTPLMKGVYPNPTKGAVTIEFETLAATVTLSIYQIDGTMVFTKLLPASNRIEAYIPGKPGLYFVELVSGQGERFVTKVTKE